MVGKPQSPDRAYTAGAVTDPGLAGENRAVDVRITFANGKSWHMWGKNGPKREQDLAAGLTTTPNANMYAGGLPVLLGSGLGYAVEQALEAGIPHLVVIDREDSILAATGLRQKYADHPEMARRITWISEPDPDKVLAVLQDLAQKHGFSHFSPAAIPIYLRLDPNYYKIILNSLPTGPVQSRDIGAYPRFRSEKPRVLLLTSKFFLLGEVLGACQRMEIPHHFLDLDTKELNLEDFVGLILKTVDKFKPDFVFTVNHLGVDREGMLMELLDRLNLPLASWFVDNPHLTLGLYARPRNNKTVIFTWDNDNIQSLKQQGFEHTFYLPLAVDATRFSPDKKHSAPASWRADISFVGNSMVEKTAKRLEASGATGELAQKLAQVAQGFGNSASRFVEDYLRSGHPDLYESYLALPTNYQRLAYQTAVTWQSTLMYRLECVTRILPFSPLIVGDPGWNKLLAGSKSWTYHRELGYYDDLPLFYPASKINFNCTSLQMKGAVNQRVFDVPACGGFLLTDHRKQIEDLFEPGREVALYHHVEEIDSLVKRYLDHPAERTKIAQAGRKRILSEHTYEQRMARAFEIMRQCFA